MALLNPPADSSVHNASISALHDRGDASMFNHFHATLSTPFLKTMLQTRFEFKRDHCIFHSTLPNTTPTRLKVHAYLCSYCMCLKL